MTYRSRPSGYKTIDKINAVRPPTNTGFIQKLPFVDVKVIFMYTVTRRLVVGRFIKRVTGPLIGKKHEYKGAALCNRSPFL